MENDKKTVLKMDVAAYFKSCFEWIGSAKKEREIRQAAPDDVQFLGEWIRRDDQRTRDVATKKKLENAARLIYEKSENSPASKFLNVSPSGGWPKKSELAAVKKGIKSKFEIQKAALEKEFSAAIIPKSELAKAKFEAIEATFTPDDFFENGQFFPFQMKAAPRVSETLTNVLLAQWLAARIDEKVTQPAPALPRQKLVWGGTVKSGIYFFQQMAKLHSPKTKKPFLSPRGENLAQWIFENVNFEEGKPSIKTIWNQLKDSQLEPVFERASIDEVFKMQENEPK